MTALVCWLSPCRVAATQHNAKRRKQNQRQPPKATPIKDKKDTVRRRRPAKRDDRDAGGGTTRRGRDNADWDPSDSDDDKKDCDEDYGGQQPRRPREARVVTRARGGGEAETAAQ